MQLNFFLKIYIHDILQLCGWSIFFLSVHYAGEHASALYILIRVSGRIFWRKLQQPV